MKPLTIPIYLIIFVFFATCSAQENNVTHLSYPSLEKNIAESDLIIEGQVVTTKVFADKGNVYTSAVIKVTKLFKGTTLDSTIELIYVGGINDSVGLIVSGGLGLTEGMEGIFLLSKNKTEVTFAKELQSYKATYGRKSYIGYHIGIHPASCVGIVYNNLEKDLFERIEAITGIPRKVLGPNMFERRAAIK